MKEKTILHSDVNNFFASVECATNSELVGKPVAVTGNPEKRTGIILAKNEIAKKYGVKTGEAIWQAKQKCPDLVTLAPHYALYEEISKKLHELYLQYTDFVEPLGLDECWLDVTPSLKYLGKTGEQIANEIRQKVKEEFGITVSIGVSFSKIFAKLGSDMKKPDATTILPRESIKSIVYPLPLNSIVGVGRKLTDKFEKMNINTIGDFVGLDINFVKSISGKVGEELHQKLTGKLIDDVRCYYDIELPKSIGNGTTTIMDITSQEDVEKVVAFLCEKVASRMAVSDYHGTTLSVSIKTNTFKTYHHSKTFAPMQSKEEIFSNARNMLHDFWHYDQPVRAIRIAISNLENNEKMEQLSFLDQKEKDITRSIQALKNKYGKDIIYVASDTVSFINRKNKDEEHK